MFDRVAARRVNKFCWRALPLRAVFCSLCCAHPPAFCAIASRSAAILSCYAREGQIHVIRCPRAVTAARSESQQFGGNWDVCSRCSTRAESQLGAPVQSARPTSAAPGRRVASGSLLRPVTDPTAQSRLRAHANRDVPRFKSPLGVRGSPGPQRAPRRDAGHPQSAALLSQTHKPPNHINNHTKTNLRLTSQGRRLGIRHLRPSTFIKGINGGIQDLQLGRRRQSKPGLDLDKPAREQRLRPNGLNVVVYEDVLAARPVPARRDVRVEEGHVQRVHRS